MPEEMPLSLIHLRAMVAATEAGAVVMPPMPAFYLRPRSVDELITHTAARALDLFGVSLAGVPRWGAPDLTRSNHDGLHRRAPVR